ncbi:Protein of unknown function [Modicisalibacter ilicicola DSM 19980]|uniref:DUF3307 domain-containing protein n=1 Tax=Modicisalibacter ilicicola DSM 19980 TaxID=1121942 RepID=A0A1M5D741_9GAMM|nr:DUF3307 domain-containing protein [Halomonas ilicicola]SHF62843.1 Protein of unknown function [Halomonas ilicicola DSM 19980]
MTSSALSLLLLLLLAHLAGDFLLQGKKWVRSKQQLGYRSPAVYQHAGVHALLALVAMLVSGQALGAALLAALAIGVSHLLIDILKSYTPDQVRYFLIDQTLHLLVILLAWRWLARPEPMPALEAWLLRPEPLAILLAYVLITRPLSILVALVMQRWSAQVDNRGTLADAGARIGMLERFLVLTFVLSGEFTPIGFLLAAKSVLRFGDLREDRDRKLTEYVLLGTMLSFSLTLLLGLALRYLLQMP